MSSNIKAIWWAAVLPTSLLMVVLPGGRIGAADELKVIQQPTFWITGQWTRILVQTPADCGKLEVAHPEQIALLDRWPHKPGETVQRFYFRAKAPLRSGELVFTSGAHRLAMSVRVLSWGAVLNERFDREVDAAHLGAGASWKGEIALPRLFPVEGKDEPKTGLSLLTRDVLEQQRASLRSLSDQAVRNAGLADNLGKLFSALPDNAIPRTTYVNNTVFQTGPDPSTGCPICGPKVYEGRSAFYPWVLDPVQHPFKVQCPECQQWFPSNDFGAGDMTSGEFPDDGWGYFNAKGRPYSFIGYYVLHYYRGYSEPDLLSRYYLATGDKRWGRATAVTLVRIAEQYLNLAINMNQRNRYTREALWRGGITPQGNLPPSGFGWSGYAPGFYLDEVWTIGRERQYGEAWERIWDYFEEEDPELLQFLRANHHPEMRSMRDVRQFIEAGYFRTVAQGLMDRAMSGNGASEQAMAMNLARILNTRRSIDLVSWAYNDPNKGMRYYLSNNFFKDGAGYESPGYNSAHYGGTIAMVDRLAEVRALRPGEYARANLPLLSDEPRYRAMFDHNINLSLISRTYANVGDDGDLAGTDPHSLRPGASLARQFWVSAFTRWPDEVNYARALWDADTNAPVRELTDPALRARATELIHRHGPYLELPSQVLDGFGHAILRAGQGDAQRSLWLRYGTMFGHGQHDGLTIGYEALRRTLLPEQGYYRGEAHRTEWDMNWAIHYCGRILGVPGAPAQDTGPQGRYGGSLRLFADGGWAQVATGGRRFYQETPPPRVTAMVDGLLQERTIALVELDAQHSYAVSIFRQGGGTDHYLSFHGPRGTAEPAGLTLTAQRGGTLAGTDVPYGIKWDSEWSKRNPHLMCFPFLYDVRRASTEAPWSVRWDLENQTGVHLRLHALPGGEVALAKGKPAGGGEPYELEWVVRHVKGAAPLASQFVEVLEAYEGQPLITEVRPLTVQTGDTGAQRPVAFQVVCGKRVDTIIHCQNPDVPVTTANGITLKGSFAVWSEEGGQVKRLFLANGARIGRGNKSYTTPDRAWSGTIASVDFRKQAVVVTPAPGDPARLVGQHARITNAQGNDVTHLIKAAHPVPGGVELTLELDPRIGEGTVQEVREDGITSAVRLMFERLYYKGKTLSNEDNTATFKINGVKESRAYLNAATHPEVGKDALVRGFADKDGDGLTRFLIYDYGAGDKLTVSTILSVAVE